MQTNVLLFSRLFQYFQNTSEENPQFHRGEHNFGLRDSQRSTYTVASQEHQHDESPQQLFHYNVGMNPRRQLNFR